MLVVFLIVQPSPDLQSLALLAGFFDEFMLSINNERRVEGGEPVFSLEWEWEMVRVVM